MKMKPSVVKLQYDLDEEALKEVDRADEYIKAKRAEIDRLTYELNLITAHKTDLLRDTLKRASVFNYYEADTLWTLWRKFHLFKSVKEKKYELTEDEIEKFGKKFSSMDIAMIEGVLSGFVNSELIEKYTFELKEIMMWGMGPQGYHFTYTVSDGIKNLEISLLVPCFNFSANEIEHYATYQASYRLGERSTAVVAYGFRLPEIKEKFSKFIEDYFKEVAND